MTIKKAYTKFTDDHLPKVAKNVLPDWRENLPKFNPNPPDIAALGPPRTALKDQNLIEAYLGGDYSSLELDMQRRPNHYTAEQKDIVQKMKNKEPLPPGVGHREINDIMLRFVESTKHVEERKKVLQKAQKKLDDPDETEVERKKNEEAHQEDAFEDTVDKKSAFIKII